ncbi:ricin-type beta-trefoil lectin domain protein [Actinacidiphila alni]|uniref:ricin-type beta-trefoil lectin domain protein n=1 Tax=Actinacidiphila alni TaxID=380248 RepID=UPI0034526CF2
MNVTARLGAVVLTTALSFGAISVGSSANATVSGFSIRNSYTGKCLNAPGYNAGLTVVTCDENNAKQRWANVAQEFQNRYPSLGGWCIKGQGHEQRALLSPCRTSTETNWVVNSLNDNARVKIANSTCGYLKEMPGSVVGCGARTVADADWWYIDY